MHIANSRARSGQSALSSFPMTPRITALVHGTCTCFAGNGTCGETLKNEDGTITVKCLGPAHSLKPGETVNVMMYLENPYKIPGNVKVLNLTSQLVDGENRPVPLSDVSSLLVEVLFGKFYLAYSISGKECLVHMHCLALV